MSSTARPTPAAARPRRLALALPRTRLAAALAVAAAVAALLWLSLLPPRAVSLDVGSVGSGDLIFLRGVYHREQVDRNNPESRTYRWARGDALIALPAGRTGATILTAELNAAPQPSGAPLAFAMAAGPHTLAFDVAEPERVYRVLVPASAADGGVVRLQLQSPTVTPPGDDRLLAVAIDRLSLKPTLGAALPALQLLGVQTAAAGALALLLWANRAPGRAVAAGAMVGALLLAALNLGARYWAGLAAAPLAAVATALAALSLVAARALPRGDTADSRFARRLWLIGLGGLALRLVGVSAPGFAFNDLDIQSILLGRVLGGEVYLFENAHEFGGGQTFYPSGPYLLALPLMLLRPALPFALHIGSALIDACGPVLLALIARELGLGRRAALIAAALLAVLPIQLTALWWGFFTNIGGQALLLLMLWLLLRHARMPTLQSAALLFVALSLVLVSHVGVLILTGTAGAIALALAWVHPRPTAAAWRGLLVAGVGALAVFALAYLSFVAAPMLGSAQGVLANDGRLSPERLAEERAYITRILPVAVWRGVGMLPFLLLIPGVPLIWSAARRPLGRAITVGWLLTPLVYVAVEYLYLVQVRYIYFLAPLCCLATAAVAERLWPRPWGRVAATLIIPLVAWLGIWLWYNGAIVGIKMSLVPLTH